MNFLPKEDGHIITILSPCRNLYKEWLINRWAGAIRSGFSIIYNGSLDREGGTENASFFIKKTRENRRLTGGCIIWMLVDIIRGMVMSKKYVGYYRISTQQQGHWEDDWGFGEKPHVVKRFHEADGIQHARGNFGTPRTSGPLVLTPGCRLTHAIR